VFVADNMHQQHFEEITTLNNQFSETDARLIIDELNRILASSVFSNSPRQSMLLRYIVENTLRLPEGSRIKEGLILMDVFKRRDLAFDPVVRNAVKRLREKLQIYYATEGKEDRILISIPRGSYQPIFSTPRQGALSSIDPVASSRSSLRVFICHSSEDKPGVRDLYKRLKNDRIAPWLDEEDLLPGQDWDYEITNAVRSSHAVIVCLSAHSVNKAGYIQKEIKKVLDVADEQPDGTIFLIPLRLEDCAVPGRLRRWQWVNLYEGRGYERLMQALHSRERAIGLPLAI
jgi:hypothetical protein